MRGKQRVAYRVLPMYLLFALFYFWLAAQIPYSHDDWDWGLSIGMQQFLHATVNSRYAGNFFEILMTRSQVLKTVIMGSVFFWIPFLLSRMAVRMTAKDTPRMRLFLFVVSNGFLLSMHPTMWSETYSWVAGCANYVISALFLLLWIRELLNATADTPQTGASSLVKTLLYGVVCLCGQLFLENLAIYCVLLGVALCVLYRKRNGQIPWRVVAMLCGAVVGLLVMFSSRVYGPLLQNGSAVGDYREIPLVSGNGVGHVVYRTALSVLNLGVRLYSLNPLLMIAVLLLLMWRCGYMPQDQRPVRYRWFLCIDALLVGGFAVGGLYDRLCVDHARWIYACDFLLSVAFAAVVLWQVVVLFGGALRRRLVWLWLSAPLVIAPLVLTTEDGCRLFFTSNLFVHLFALLLLGDGLRHANSNRETVARCIGGAVTAALVCFYGVAYSSIGMCHRERLDIIATAVETGADTIRLPAFPFAKYLHFPDPNEEVRVAYFAEFYGIPEDVEIVFESSLG